MIASEDEHVKQAQGEHADGRPRLGISAILMPIVLLITLPLSIIIHLSCCSAERLAFKCRTVDERIARQRRQKDVQNAVETALTDADQNYQRQMAELATQLADRGMLSPDMRPWLPADYEPKKGELPKR